jgi:predicted ATPase
LADAYRLAGRHDDALSTIEQGLQFAENRCEGFRTAELLRIKGAVLLEQAPENLADSEACVVGALQLARHQGAKSIELRASIDLARLWQAQARTDESLDLLGAIYNWFTEGFETVLLKKARLLLDGLNSQ